MATAVVKAVSRPTKGQAPQTAGVSGRIVDCPPGLVFGKGGKVSPYDVLLEQLAMAPNKVLEFGDLRAKASLYARSKRNGLKVAFAQSDNTLYVKFAGYLPGSDRWKRELRTAIKDVIQTQPRMEGQIAVAVRAKGFEDADAGIVGAILKQWEQTGEVERQRDGSWKLN